MVYVPGLLLYTFSQGSGSDHTYLTHFRAPGQLWIRLWMVGWENPKKSAPDGSTLDTGFPLNRRGRILIWELRGTWEWVSGWNVGTYSHSKPSWLGHSGDVSCYNSRVMKESILYSERSLLSAAGEKVSLWLSPKWSFCLSSSCWPTYAVALTAESSSAWQSSAEEPMMAFWGSSSGTISNWGRQRSHESNLRGGRGREEVTLSCNCSSLWNVKLVCTTLGGG